MDKKTTLSNVVISDNSHSSDLHEALSKEDIDVNKIKNILKSQKISINQETRRYKVFGVYHEMKALHLAACRGSYQVVRLLIASGAHITIKDDYGWTPVHYATYFAHKKTLDLLLSYDVASICVWDKSGATPLYYATELSQKGSSVHKDILHYLMKYKAKSSMRVFSDQVSPLHSAIFQENLNEVQRLLKDPNIDVNAKEQCYQSLRIYRTVTALHIASYLGLIKITAELIKSGANVNMQDGNGQTPIHYAAKFGYIGILDLLIKNKNDEEKLSILNHQDGSGLTALHKIIHTHNLEQNSKVKMEFVMKLLQHGADIDLQDRSGFTPLHSAMSEINSAIYAQPCSEIDPTTGREKNSRNHDQVIKQLLPIVRFLIECGADHTKQNLWRDIPNEVQELPLFIEKITPKDFKWRYLTSEQRKFHREEVPRKNKKYLQVSMVVSRYISSQKAILFSKVHDKINPDRSLRDVPEMKLS